MTRRKRNPHYRTLPDGAQVPVNPDRRPIVIDETTGRIRHKRPDEPWSDFDRLMQHVDPITSDHPSPVTLSSVVQDGRILRHRYIPRWRVIMPGLTDEQYRLLAEKWMAEQGEAAWIEGPPKFEAAAGVAR